MALDEHTGTPPAVTHEKLVVWRKLSEDVTAALAMGGDQGLDLLTSLMPEWCEALEDVNAARETCVDLADKGRRDEALEWHADGFFDVADLLSTDRAGWDAWAEALITRGIAIPAMSNQLKEMTDRIHEERVVQDISGRTFADHVDDLRRNVLAKGHYGERLTHLEAIRELHPAGAIWKEMIEPIQQVRASEIVADFHAAIREDDFFAIHRLEREVAVTRWDNGIPCDVQDLTEACSSWRTARDGRQQLSRTVSGLLDRGNRLDRIMKDGGADRIEFNAALDAARKESIGFLELYQQATAAVAVADRVPQVAQRIAAEGLKQALKQSTKQVEDVLKSIDRAREYWKWLKRYRRIESEIHAHVEKAPLEGGSWDEAKRCCDRWLEVSAGLLGKRLKLESESPIQSPACFQAEMRSFERRKEQVTQRKRSVIAAERRVLMLVIGGIVTVVAIIFLLLIVAIAGRS
jgi:hypothetical protein